MDSRAGERSTEQQQRRYLMVMQVSTDSLEKVRLPMMSPPNSPMPAKAGISGLRHVHFQQLNLGYRAGYWKSVVRLQSRLLEK